MNNYEKIKNMSVDEMAEFYRDNFGCELSYCPCEWSNEHEDCGDDCYGAIKSWLLKEYEE